MPRFILRFNNLMQGHQPFVRMRTKLFNIVTFKAGGNRQDDIGKSTRRGPLMIQYHHGFQLLPCLDHAITILLRMEWIRRAVDRHFNIRPVNVSPLKATFCPAPAGSQRCVRWGYAPMRRENPLYTSPVEDSRSLPARRVQVRWMSPYHRRCNASQTLRRRPASQFAQPYWPAPPASGILFAMMHALYAPTAHKLGPAFDQQAGEITDLLRRQATDLRCPFGIFGCLSLSPSR